MHEFFTYYAGIMLDAFLYLLCSKLCRHNWHRCSVKVFIYILVLVVEFPSGEFTGSESSGFIEVIVRITGGVSTSPINVTVTPSVQSPVSAMGM